MIQTAIYPGTFDPVTNGHLDLIVRAAGIFPHLVVAVAENARKNPWFSLADRVRMIQEHIPGGLRVEVIPFDGLLVTLAGQIGASVLIRGVRAISDFDYELQMALMNRDLDMDVETIFMVPSKQYSYLSSSLVKELARYGASTDGLVPESVALSLKDYSDKAGEK